MEQASLVTDYSQIILWAIMILFGFLLALSEALAKSKKFAPNSNLELIQQACAGAWNNIKAQQPLLVRKALEMGEDLVETQIGKLIDKPAEKPELVGAPSADRPVKEYEPEALPADPASVIQRPEETNNLDHKTSP